jgi:5-methylcytosine-specific restriction endonuclease McrA
VYETRDERQKFYLSKEWRNLREYKLSLDPYCYECKKNDRFVGAVHVHHIIDIADDPNKALNIKNLLSLCKACHSRITFKKLLKTNNPNSKKNTELKIYKKLWKVD